MPVRSAALSAAVLTMAIAGAACSGSSGGDASPTSPSTPNAATITVVRENGAQSFSPNPAVMGGQLVVFRNIDAVTHRVVLNDGSIDTGDIRAGESSAAVLMPAAGTNYHCSIHPTMVGAVSPSSGGAAPPCVGQYCDG